MKRWGDEERGAEGGRRGGVAICRRARTSVGVGSEIEREIVCAICQVLQRRFSLCTYIVCVNMCVCFLFQNEASGLFIESPSPLSVFPAVITKRAAAPLNNKEMGNVAHILSVASVWSSLSLTHVCVHTHPSPTPAQCETS